MKTVMLIDDSEADLLFSRIIVSRSGLCDEVLEFESASAALAHLRMPAGHDVDMILLDINMPGMDGYAVCRALREQTLFDDTVIIAQTGWGQTQARAAPGESGFNHHLVKPVTMDRLEELLADIASARAKSHVAN